jgi:hypothetical protein
MPATPVRMGAHVALADDQTPMGSSTLEILTRDDTGAEVRRSVAGPRPAVLRIVHFVDLEDGRGVTTEELGEQTLELSLECTEDELRDEIREFVFEEEMRDIPELADLPRWTDMIEVLNRAGVLVDEAKLAELPFAVELEADVMTRLSPPGSP